MSNSNNIRNLLDIQNPNIIFVGNCVNNGAYKGHACIYVDGKLTYNPKYCKNCGIKNTDNTVTKNGTQLSRIILPTTGTFTMVTETL